MSEKVLTKDFFAFIGRDTYCGNVYMCILIYLLRCEVGGRKLFVSENSLRGKSIHRSVIFIVFD